MPAPPSAAYTGWCARKLVKQYRGPIGLRAQLLSDPEFYRQAAALTAQLITTIEQPVHHMGIRRIREILRANTDRL
jgi:hypothetical protein